jgi:hypothetical protein
MNQTILGPQGFDIYEVTPNEWVLDTKVAEIYAGTFVQMATYAALKYGFSLDEIEFAVTEMTKHGHNGAHFGVNRGFIFSFTMDFTNGRITA